MPRISIDYYELEKGDPIDQPIVACIASYAVQNKLEHIRVMTVNMLYGNDHDCEKLFNEAYSRFITTPGTKFITLTVGISRLEFPPDKYTIEKENEQDTREIISIDEVMAKKIEQAKQLGFEPIFNDPGSLSSICIFTGLDPDLPMPCANELLEFIRNLPEENPEPTHMKVTEDELIKMMGGDINAETTDESSDEGKASE